ncbi:MAG TPA: beta-propeller fold lactonase family protein [Acidiferrobacter sp.]|nr:beta-propeller fold lactonase family protein [Acidiferrobacter sp.]
MGRKLGRWLIMAGLSLGCTSVLAHTFVYVANYNNSMIASFVEHSDGTLLARGDVRTPSGPEAIVIDKEGFVVTADSRAHAISVYRIQPTTGHLTQVAVWREDPRANPFSLAASPHGQFLYVANSGDSTVGIYRLDPTTGAITDAGIVHEPHGAKPYAIAPTPNGQFVYVANFGNDTIGMYRRLPGHGQLHKIGIFHETAGNGPYSLSIGPDGRFLYVADYRTNILLVLAITKTGALSLRDRIAEPFDHHPDSLVIDPSGRYLFVANTSANDISIFRIDRHSGRLTHVGHVATGSYPFSLTLDAAARFVYAVNFGNSTISRYRLNRDSGVLTPIGTTAEASYADPYGIAAVTISAPTPSASPVPKKPKPLAASGKLP